MNSSSNTKISSLKSALNLEIDSANPDGTYQDETVENIHRLISELTPLTPTPRPIDEQLFVQSAWGSRFAQFGPRHTAGKPILHETKLNYQCFSSFPAVPIRITDLRQEICVVGNHYNNVSEISTPDGQHHCRLIVWGRYLLRPEAPQRYEVSFYAVEMVPPEGVSPQTLCAQFGLEEGGLLRRELTPPKFHSDVVFCDEDMRINFGSVGGVYVMSRLAGPAKSVDLS